MSFRIALLTNDDGIDAEGLASLRRVAEKFFTQVWVVAPAEQASEIGHRVTTKTPIRFERREERVYAVHGTPADCTRVALSHLLPEEPDWVLSGINHGGNLGRHDFVISGTMAAVREAAFRGYKGAAFSHYIRPEYALDWLVAEELCAQAFAALHDEAAGPGEFWSINLPHNQPDYRQPEVIFCEHETLPLDINFVENADGHLEYAGKYHDRPRRDGTDVAVCFGGDVAVTRASI